MSKMLKEFRDFAFKGNVIDMAVGVIIGSAFSKIVSSLVADIFTPFISLITGNASLEDTFVILKKPLEIAEDADLTTLAGAKAAGCTVFSYGNFIQTIIDFLLVAICIFIFVKLISTARKKADEAFKRKEPAAAPVAPPAPTTKKCPYCCSEIAIEATRCPHCTSELPKE